MILSFITLAPEKVSNYCLRALVLTRQREDRGAVTTMNMDGESRVMEMFTRVRASGLKLTPQRMAIVREIALDPTHPTAQELFERLRLIMPTMSFATVYNTLDALSSAGLCAALSLSPGAARFDANMRPHNHAVCDRCGLVRDVPCTDELQPNACDVDTSIGVVAGFSLRTVERIYRGVCANCADENASSHSDKP